MDATTLRMPTAADEFFISRNFGVPRELVWRAWTEPRRMAQWWGPRGFTNPVCDLDVRPGGAWRIVMRGEDGTDYPIKGVFREVVAPERLVMLMDLSEHPGSWHDMINPARDRSKGRPALNLLQTATFEEQADGTLLTIRTRFESVALRDAMVKIGMNEGWSLSLDRLAEHLGGKSG
jgi:uncharacterized protein YndB with AHSA1/START domain